MQLTSVNFNTIYQSCVVRYERRSRCIEMSQPAADNCVMLKQQILEVKKITGDIRALQEERSFFLDVIPLAFQYH